MPPTQEPCLPIQAFRASDSKTLLTPLLFFYNSYTVWMYLTCVHKKHLDDLDNSCSTEQSEHS